MTTMQGRGGGRGAAGGEAARPRVTRNRDGVWCCRLYLGTSPATGRPVRPYRSFPAAASREEAEREAAEWAAPLLTGDLVACLEAYVDDVEAQGAPRGGGPRPNTVDAYRRHVRRVAALLGGERAGTVTPAKVTAAYRRLLDPDGPWALSRSTVANLHWFLSGAFRWMVSQGMVDASPMGDVSHPTASRGPSGARALDEASCAALSAELGRRLREGTPFEREAALAALVALATGARVGEACALRRCDLRPFVPDLHVCGTAVERGGLHRQDAPKRGRGRRVAISADDLALLEAHMDGQGGRPPESPIASVDGSLLRPSQVSAALRDAAREAGLPGWVRFHTLRHTHATALLLLGVDMRTVQERLGHADVATTLALYGHVLPGRDAAAAAAYAAAARRWRAGPEPASALPGARRGRASPEGAPPQVGDGEGAPGEGGPAHKA